ncbi:protein OCTOPUS-like [Rosa rugosa]|uniref:protein OCTOPUS-like n=1 Tax=Rosa rugosa TaxID=74645 RepID=UPI002B40E43B|nr:protein OCTOPUS-like [Rosa rugosa]
MTQHRQAQAQAQPHRRSTCHRHPTTPITGFCAPCLSERLAGLDSSSPSAAVAPQNAHSGSSELRRSKSCCGTRPESSAYPPEPPRRKSCDVRNRNTLSELFNIDDHRKGLPRRFEIDSSGQGFELKEEPEEEHNGDETRASDAEFKTMKELIDLELQRKKGNGRDLREIAGTFWETASNKVRQWRRKQKPKKLESEGLGSEKRSARRGLRETQSEVGEYALGRRSCDTDLDPGRMSLDEPRASWDGYMSSRAYPRMTPMVSVVEDVKMSEEEGLESLERSPGGSAQTKDYYFSQTRRRRSFERSSACAHSSKGVMPAQVDELKLVSNGATELFYGAKLLITEKELMESSSSNSKSVEEDGVVGGGGVGSIEGVCGNVAAVSSNGVDQKPQKWHKRWKFWGLMQRKSQAKHGGGAQEESWKKLRRVANGEANNASVSQKLIRSYSVSCRNSCKMVGLFSNVSTVESKGNGLKTLHRNRSARYSPSNLDHGLLRFYLTPLRSYRRSESWKSRLPNNNSPQTLAKNVL